MTLRGKKILIGITGGIAAYKVCELIRLFIKQKADVKVVLTPSAKEFVTQTTLQALTRNPVYSEQFEISEWKPEHINLADSSDLFIIAPASANTIGKIANGICDNLLTTLVMAFKKPIILAPAMNCNMWDNKFFKKNLNELKQNAFHLIQPEIGELACGYEGNGRMAEPQTIFKSACEILNANKVLKGKRILITAGGTKEELDPVRYIGNYSSGKMGIALADKAFELGADVTLISTVKVDKAYNVINVKTAEEMLRATQKTFLTVDVLIMAAAVADYRPEKTAEQKIKKEDSDALTLTLVKNPDILKEIAKIKQEDQIVVGFCAESENLLNNAKSKLDNKNLDFIVANDISNPEIGFNSDFNEAVIINKSGSIKKIEEMPKVQMAQEILNEVFPANA